MKYWDWVERSHERMSKDFPNGEEGYGAVCFIRSFFEQIGIEELLQNHPLHNKLRIGMVPNYSWLIQYARKLLTASQLSGFGGVVRRFANPREYLAANDELEVALKVYLEGLDVSFSEVATKPTCDIIANLGSEVIRIEVTSLNPPDEEMLVFELVNRVINLGFMKKVATGGFVSRVPSPKILEDVLKQVDQAIDEIKDSRKVKKFNYEGVATIYLAPYDNVDQMPEDSRHSFHFVQPPRKPIEEQIKRKIGEKNIQLKHRNELGMLFLYTQMIDRQSVSKLFEHPMDHVSVALASYSKLLGLVLTVPHLGIEVANAVKTGDLKKECRGGKLFLETEAGSYQYESSLLWKNLYADRDFPEKIVTALENYSSNLSKLSPLQDSFAGFRTTS
jgi:hypothetical protein